MTIGQSGDARLLLRTIFEVTIEFGTDFETCSCPYGRLLNHDEVDLGQPGTAGVSVLEPSRWPLVYLIYYGFEGYDDHVLSTILRTRT